MTNNKIKIDASHRNCKAGIRIFAFLAEFGGTGVYLAYLSVEKNNSSKFSLPKTMTQIPESIRVDSFFFWM